MQYQSTTLRKTTEDLTEKTFNRLTVKSFAGYSRDYGKAYWKCICICGNFTEIVASKLRSGTTKSCGCLNIEKVRLANTIHGQTNTPEWRAWQSMLRRCENPRVPNYQDYGGRGITVCPAWHDFQTFLKDMGPRPTSRHSLERLDNNAGYFPANCVWILHKLQARNTRRSRMLTYHNKTQCVAAWAEETGLPYQTIGDRLKDGWPVEKTLTTPLRKKRNST